MLLNVSHGKEDMDYTIFNEKKKSLPNRSQSE